MQRVCSGGLSGNHYKVVTTTLTAAILIKHALESLSDTLRMKLKPFGIDVIIIEPGGTKTEWNGVSTRSMMAQTREDSVYREMVEALAKRPGTYC